MAVMQLPDEPMLTASTNTPAMPAGMVAEPKWDGFRAFVARWDDGRVLIRSRHGTDMTTGFPEIARAAAELPPEIGSVLFDGELVVWDQGRLAFERLQPRLNAKPTTALRLAGATPANFVAFDLLHLGETVLTDRPYRERRARLEQVFEDFELAPPWTLCPATTDPETIALWLSKWTRFGIEGVCWKRPQDTYQSGRRAWLKYRLRSTTEAVIGAVAGSITRPQSLLLGRFDQGGRLRYVGRTTPLKTGQATEIGQLLAPAGHGHPWTGARFSAAWGSRDSIEPVLVRPELVAEISVDTAQERGQFRHLVKLVRVRPDLDPADAPRAESGREPASG